MAEATSKPTGAPARRKPAAAKTTSATTKAAPTKGTQKPAAATKTATKAAAKPPTAPVAEKPAEDEGITKELVEFEFVNETKSYNVFQPPADSGCVGKFYAPHGTLEVKALLVMDAEASE